MFLPSIWSKTGCCGYTEPRERAQAGVSRRNVLPSLLTVTGARGSLPQPSICPEPAQDPLQLRAPHHTDALFREKSLIKREVRDAFLTTLLFKSRSPRSLLLPQTGVTASNGWLVWAVAHDPTMLGTLQKREMIPLSFTKKQVLCHVSKRCLHCFSRVRVCR